MLVGVFDPVSLLIVPSTNLNIVLVVREVTSTATPLMVCTLFTFAFVRGEKVIGFVDGVECAM